MKKLLLITVLALSLIHIYISIITVPCPEKPLTARGNSGTCTMIKRLKAVWTLSLIHICTRTAESVQDQIAGLCTVFNQFTDQRHRFLCWMNLFTLYLFGPGRKRSDIIYYVCGTDRNTISTMKQNKLMYKLSLIHI